MEESVVPSFFGLFIVPVVPKIQSARHYFLCPDADLTGGTRRTVISVFVQDMHIVRCDRLTHRTQTDRGTDKVSDNQRSLGLTETFHQTDTGSTHELIENFRIQCLTGDGGILQRSQIIMGKIFLDQETVHRRRCAECGHMILGEHRQDLIGMELVEIECESRRLAEPLAVELTPEGLAPAGVGDGEMQTIRIDIVPVFCRGKMTQRVFM